MCDPRLDIPGSKDGQVGSHKMVEGIAAFFVGDDGVVVAGVIVAQLVIAAGFLEVFGGGSVTLRTGELVGSRGDARIWVGRGERHGRGEEEDGGEEVGELHVDDVA